MIRGRNLRNVVFCAVCILSDYHNPHHTFRRIIPRVGKTLLTEMGPRGIPAPTVIVLSAHALERCSLVDRYTRAAMLVLVVGVWVLHRSTQG